MSTSLSQKVVIITGASSGIGAASARTLAGLGCRVVLAARSGEKLEALENRYRLGDGFVHIRSRVPGRPLR